MRNSVGPGTPLSPIPAVGAHVGRGGSVDDRTRTCVRPPPLVRLPRAGDELEYSTRSIGWSSDGRTLWRVWGTADRPWVVGVSVHGRRWHIEARGASSSASRSAVREMFSLDHDLSAFYRLVRHEAVLRGSERSFRGLRLPRDPSLYESLAHAIVGQQLSVRAADTLWQRVLRATNAYVRVGDLRLSRAPPPREIRRLGPTGLRSLGLSRAKSRALSSLAEGEIERRFDAGEFRRLGREEAIARLDAEPGIGRWTAENALARGTGRTDLFIAGDLGLRVALARYGVLPRDAPEEAARAWADEHYPGWGSYATLYLWRKLVRDYRAKKTPGG